MADDVAPGSSPARLTAWSHGAGCACKLSMDELRAVLATTAPVSHPDLLVGPDVGDDAAVWRRPDGPALVATTDFFTPIVDDPRDWGRIAAANAVSDVYAMGGRPLFALNVVGWPRALPAEVLGEVLGGAAEVAATAGYPLVGGHTIDSAEPLYGQAVVGEVDEDRTLTNAGADAGDTLVLTKPIGTGIATTAAKRSPVEALDREGPVAVAHAAAVASMTRLNRTAAELAVGAGVRAATDVTGFGLLGHLHRMLVASGAAAELLAHEVPVLEGVADLLVAGHVPGGTRRNAEQVAPCLATPVAEPTLLLLADAQTSGGLLLSCPPQVADDLVRELRATGHGAAAVGTVTDGTPGEIRVR